MMILEGHAQPIVKIAIYPLEVVREAEAAPRPDGRLVDQGGTPHGDPLVEGVMTLTIPMRMGTTATLTNPLEGLLSVRAVAGRTIYKEIHPVQMPSGIASCA